MFRTVFLTDEDYNFKEFNSLNVVSLSSKKISKNISQKVFNDLIVKSKFVENFYFSNGQVELKFLDNVYCLEHIPVNTDLILPKDPKTANWVLLYYNQTDIIYRVSYDKKTPIKIRGNGRRIMGLDEPLLCDLPFMSLKLTYLDNNTGWVVT